VAAHLAQISQLLGTQMPGLADALKQPAQAAVAAPAAKAVTAGPPSNGGGAPAAQRPPAQHAAATQQAPAVKADSGNGNGNGNGAPKQPAAAKTAKGDAEEWWEE
jgi:hypothetical protein